MIWEYPNFRVNIWDSGDSKFFFPIYEMAVYGEHSSIAK